MNLFFLVVMQCHFRAIAKYCDQYMKKKRKENQDMQRRRCYLIIGQLSAGPLIMLVERLKLFSLVAAWSLKDELLEMSNLASDS